MIGIDIDRTTREDMKILHPRRVIAATARAINKTARAVRKEASIGIRDELALKARTVKANMHLEKARYSANPKATIAVDKKAIPLKDYGARQIRRGVSVRVKTHGGRRVVKHGFIIEKYKKHVFLRMGDERFPVSTRWGPSMYKQFEEILPGLDDEARETLDKRIREEIAWEIEKLRRR